MKLIKSQFNIITIIISAVLTLIICHYKFLINLEDIKNALSSIITLASVNFALYGVTLSIIAGIHERAIIKKLLRNGSKSKKELEDNDSKVFILHCFRLYSLLYFKCYIRRLLVIFFINYFYLLIYQLYYFNNLLYTKLF